MIKVKIKDNQDNGYTVKIKHDNVFHIIKLIDSLESEDVEFIVNSKFNVIESYLKQKGFKYKIEK